MLPECNDRHDWNIVHCTAFLSCIMRYISIHNHMPCWSLTIDCGLKHVITNAFIDLLTMKNDTEKCNVELTHWPLENRASISYSYPREISSLFPMKLSQVNAKRYHWSLVNIFRLSNGDTKPQLTDILVENYFPVKPGKCTYYSTAIYHLTNLKNQLPTSSSIQILAIRVDFVSKHSVGCQFMLHSLNCNFDAIILDLGTQFCWISAPDKLNSSPPGQNGRHFSRQHFQMHFCEWNVLYFD